MEENKKYMNFKKYNDGCLIFNVVILLSKEAIIAVFCFFIDIKPLLTLKNKNHWYFCYKFLSHRGGIKSELHVNY